MKRPQFIAIRHAAWIACLILTMVAHSYSAQQASADTLPNRVPVQFIAVLGDPSATSGTGAETWGLWRRDPGIWGVWLSLFKLLRATGGHAPGGWVFDGNDWWLEEHGLIMEKPEFPIPAGKYVVTGEREVTALLTVHPANDDGSQEWELSDNAVLFDVTHLPCRSARYTPAGGEQSCTPANADQEAFPIDPGAPMPSVSGCHKQDYAVLLVLDIIQ